MKVLVTGFEPFGGDAVNASWEAVRTLAERWEDEAELVTTLLPVTFTGAVEGLRAAIEEHRPDVVVAVGLAAGTDAVRLERVAVNVTDARIPDSSGAQPIDEPVVDGAPAAYFSTLPLKAALVALHDAGVPAVVSNSAGTYVCNAAFYALQHLLVERTAVRSGFVHVPPTASLALDVLVQALQVVVRTAVAHASGAVAEPLLAAGTEH